jgi:hypothetical protein
LLQLARVRFDKREVVSEFEANLNFSRNGGLDESADLADEDGQVDGFVTKRPLPA